MSQPRLALLHYSAPPIIGGVEATLGAHAKLFAEHGYPIKLVVGRGEQPEIREPDSCLEFVHIPEMDSRHPRVETIQRELNAGRVPAAFDELSEELEGALAHALQDVAVCFAHNVVTLHKNLALTAALHRLAQSGRLALIAWCHDFAWDEPVYANEVHAGMPWDLLREPWANVKYVVVSEVRRDELARLLRIDPNTIRVIPPGIDPQEFFALTPTVAQWVARFALLEAAPLLLLPARVTRRKNIELAIDITAALRAAGLAPKLVVMGPLGPHNPKNRTYLEELKTRAAQTGSENAILFLQEYGEVSDAARRDLYALADGLVFPSAREGFGIPILEAGLARLPLFCSDIPPFRESAGAFAHYFALDEPPPQIAARIRELFKNDARYQLKRRVLDKYSWQRILNDRIEPLLKHTTNEKQT